MATTKGFTATRIATLPAGRYKDPGQRSLYLLVRDRKDDKPSRTWLHRTKVKGGDTFLMVGHWPETSLEAARDTIRKQIELLSQGIDPKAAAPRRRAVRTPKTLSAAAVGSGHSVEFLAQEFMERFIKPTRKQPGYVQAILDKDVLPEWKGRDARTIKPGEVIKLLDKIVDRGKPVMANRTAAVLRQLFKFGIHRAIIEDTPVKLLVLPGGKEKPRQRALSDAELSAYLANPLACTRAPRLAHVINILLLTAVRRGELAAAKWSHIDFKAALWTLPPENTKTAREQIVPLSAWAMREFRQLKKAAGRSPWVLPSPDPARRMEPNLLTRGPMKCAERFAKQGIAAFTLHDLRRTCRTGLARLKVAPHIGELCLGHSLGKIAGTYDVHGYLEEKRAALNSWALHLEALAAAPVPETPTKKGKRKLTAPTLAKSSGSALVTAHG